MARISLFRLKLKDIRHKTKFERQKPRNIQHATFNTPRKMPRWLRITLRLFTGLVGLIIILWLGVAWYINSHKQEILKEITERLSESTGGTLVIKDMEPSLWKSFPDISIALKEVSLRDSLYEQHHHSLLEMKTLFVKVNTFQLLSRKTEIRKITAAHGAIYLYTDSSGYSNEYLLSSKKPQDTSAKKGSTLIAAFGLEDMDFFFVHGVKRKLFHIHINNLDGTTEQVKDIWQLHVNVDAHIYQFCFNTIRGSFLKDKDLDMDVGMTYDPDKKQLSIPDQEIDISGQPLMIATIFNFGKMPAAFSMHLHAPEIRYKTAVSWMSQNIAKKLDSFDFEKPVAVDVQINGVMKYKNIPLIRVSYLIKDNMLITNMGDIDDVSFNGFYFNEALAGNGHGDDNSQLQFRQVSGKWNEIPFTMDTLNVTNLLVPFLNAHIHSKFPLTTMNDIVGGNSFAFNKGEASADLHYIGGVLAADTTPYTINGFVKIADANMSYLPRALTFNNVGATVLFKDDNLFLRDVHLASKGSSVTMEGEALHFLRLYFTNPDKILIAWRIKSPVINLNDFLSFVGKRKEAANSPAASKNKTRIGGQIDKVLNASSIDLDAVVNKMIFKNFVATNVVAKASLAQSGITIEKAGLNHAGGTLNISGVINQAAQNNPFRLKADINNVDVNVIFKSFDNFGQTAITDDNLQGKLTANAVIAGQMTEGGKIINNSMDGTVDFKLLDGVLDHYSPLEKISRFVFRNRNLSHVTFKEIHDKLTIAGNKITIPPMIIETSAVNMNIQGVYGMPKGTEIFMSIPIRNPEKEEPSTIVGKWLRRGKGIVINLRAQDGDEKGVKIGWDPFKHGRKALEDTAAVQ